MGYGPDNNIKYMYSLSKHYISNELTKYPSGHTVSMIKSLSKTAHASNQYNFSVR